MKKYILKSLFVSVLCMLAASCQDTEFAEAVDSSKAQVMFSIAMDSPAARSRATWGENEKDPSALIGDEYDNHIDLNQFIVKIEADGKTYNVTDIIKWKEGSEAGYKFVGIVNGITGKTTLTNPRITVYANMGTDVNVDFTKMIFNQNATNIPMFGVFTPETETGEDFKLTFEPGKRTTVSTISLLRAMAKIEVSLSSAMQNAYALTGVTLNKHNAQGYCLPNANEIADANTTDMNTDAVFNPLKVEGEEQVALPFEEATANATYVIYLPEVAKEDGLSISVDLTAKDTEGNLSNETATGKFDLKNFTTNEAINVVRNHWYKYTINDFAATNVNVNFEELSWDNHTVNINVGGEGFLALNKDVIEMFGTNIDAEQLKFSSSSPITIELADVYEHRRNDEIVEGSADGVFAYYIDMFGVPTQLPAASDTDDEHVILANTSAVVAGNDPTILNGNIKITSPFMPDASATNGILKAGSHYNTIRYLEFKVTNTENLHATFRVMQYPPIIISSEEGFFSYRDDFELGDEYSYHNPNAFQSAFGKIAPTKQGPIHFLNPVSPFYTLSGFLPYHEHECNSDGVITQQGCSAYKGYEELLYGFMERDYHRSYSFSGPIAAAFHRDHYDDINGNPVPSDSKIEGGNSKYYQAFGPCYQDKETGKYYRRHYTGNFFETFWPKVVRKVHKTDESVNVVNKSRTTDVYKNITSGGQTKNLRVSANRYEAVNRKKGQADIYKISPNDDYDGWGNYPDWTYTYTWTYTTKDGWKSKSSSKRYEDLPQAALFNHHMYEIKTTTSSSGDYTIGQPALVEGFGGSVYSDIHRGCTAEGEENSRRVSPSFMVASQLGETILPTDEHHYVMPGIGGIYYYAKRQCQEYVETTYEDLDNDYEWDEDEPVKHYHDWRLPTKAELELILKYQKNSRVMDIVLNGESYFHASLSPFIYDESTCLSYVGEDYNTEFKGYYVRCVRDVK